MQKAKQKPTAVTGAVERREPAAVLAVDVPIADASTVDGKHKTRHVDISLSASEAATLARVRNALNEADARLSSREGKHVHSSADAVRWLLERVRDAETPEGGGHNGET